MSETARTAGERLNALLAEVGLEPVGPELARRFEDYLSLILRWNAWMNLTAVRDEEAILSRHFVESIACARALPAGIRTLLDFGSGAGLPGIPIALCRPEMAVTLAESQGKKAAFLAEAVRVLGISATVYGQRAETVGAVFDCVVLRAVDRMEAAVRAAGRLVCADGWLALMTTDVEIEKLKAAAGPEFSWPQILPLPDSSGRMLALAARGSGFTSK